MNKIIFLLIAIALISVTGSAFGQELRRSASFGALIDNLNDSSRSALKLSSSSGTVIKKVVAGSSAQRAGFSVNDVLVSMDGENISNASHFVTLLKKHHGGDNVKIGYYRKSRLKTTNVHLLPKPMETSNDYDILYSSVHSGNNQLRTIITKPKDNGIHPAVLLIGGVGCYSIDNPSIPDILSIKMWADSLTTNGYVTLRVEKTGMGDSKGVPCSECDFNTEKQGFLDGLKQLKSLPYVDRENIFIAGFSIGGVIAPLIAKQEPVKGIIVYGTIGRNWLEYELENAFRQQQLDNKPADSLDLYMRAEYIRLYGLFVEKKTPQEIIGEHPGTARNFFRYPMRIEYFQQVADVDIHALWMNTKAIVLVMHGASDFVSSSAEHRLIAETVNRYHPGNADYTEIANADHWGLVAVTEKASYLHQQTELNSLPLAISIRWLKDKS